MKSLLVNQTQDSNNSSGDPFVKILIEKTAPSASLTLSIPVLSLVSSRSVGGTYRIVGRFPKCPFLHLDSFSPSGVLEVVLILEER